MTRLPFNQSPEDLLWELESVRAAAKADRAHAEELAAHVYALVAALRRQTTLTLILAAVVMLMAAFQVRSCNPAPARVREVPVLLTADVPRGSWWERFWRHNVPGITVTRRVRTMAPA